MKNGRMQAKDIDDKVLLAAVRKLSLNDEDGKRREWSDPPYWVMALDLEKELGLDDRRKLVLAKCQALIDRGLLDGCACGCRGDFEMTTNGDAFLDSTRRHGEEPEK
jgi:hypothetical protein